MSYDFTRLHELQVQAMLFDMDIDLETFQLVPKETYQRPEGLIRWADKQDESDFDILIDIGDWNE